MSVALDVACPDYWYVMNHHVIKNILRVCAHKNTGNDGLKNEIYDELHKYNRLGVHGN